MHHAQGGSTKMKIARVSGARLDLQDRDGRLDIFGTSLARSRAKDYVGYVLTQRTGPVFINTTDKRDDLSIVNVPEVSTSADTDSVAVQIPPCTRSRLCSGSGDRGCVRGVMIVTG
jgi:hypothetical protein